MNRSELGEALKRQGVPDQAYSIWGDRNESYCMIHDALGFHVFTVSGKKGMRSEYSQKKNLRAGIFSHDLKMTISFKMRSNRAVGNRPRLSARTIEVRW